MGTNYYAKPLFGPIKHIGKSSFGWCFALHVYPEEGLSTLDDWKKFLTKRRMLVRPRIVDEYGREISFDKMMRIITERTYKSDIVPFGYNDWEHFYRSNHAISGPNGLARSIIGSVHCVGHGDGTWDYIVGDFC